LKNEDDRITARWIAQAVKDAGGWVSGAQLSAILEIPERRLREAIHTMRIAGDPTISCIVSNSQWGYLWMEDESAVDNLCRPIEKHARRQLAAMAGIRRAAKRAQKGQMVLL
jgi:hypothetical protein